MRGKKDKEEEPEDNTKVKREKRGVKENGKEENQQMKQNKEEDWKMETRKEEK